MSVGSTMKWMGRSAKERAENVAHDMKDRALERRLDRAHAESERLRHENDLLRDEVSESRAEHRRLFELIEERFNDMTTDEDEETTGKKRSHKGRWFLFLLAVGGGVYYWMRQRSGGAGEDEWGSGMADMPAVTETGTSTTL